MRLLHPGTAGKKPLNKQIDITGFLKKSKREKVHVYTSGHTMTEQSTGGSMIRVHVTESQEN